MRLFSATILTLVIWCSTFGQTDTLKQLAGGELSVNNTETAAILPPAGSVALDGAGNLFFENGRHVVLRLDATTGVVTPVAGNGTAGYSGDGGPATSAQLNYPEGVAVDAAGNLYISDFGNHRIRKVSNGVITTVAGNGKYGFSGDNGPATVAQLNGAWGVAVDSAGNLYISDSGNHRIRKVSNGVIITIAGNGTGGYSGDNGPATVAQLNAPQGIAVDSTGTLYIAEVGNACIRRISNGVITTAAGNGTHGFSGDNGPPAYAQLGYPWGVAVDATGNLYIADPLKHSIRKVSNGVITTVAGSGVQGYSGDGGPATSAQLNRPSDVAVDAAGNLYIADARNYRVRKVSNGVIITMSSTIAARPLAPR